MNYKIAQLIMTAGQKAGTTSEIFISQPDMNKETIAGKLFVLIEIESKKINDLKFINFIIENLNNNYYQNDKIILREKVKSVKIEHIFESAIAKTNRNIAIFCQKEKIKINPELINATAGVVYNDGIFFSSIGKNKILLIHKKGDGENLKYNIIDILKHTEEDSSQKTPNKLFSSVISGKIPKGGHIFITNEALPEYFSEKQLIDTLTSLQPTGAVEQMKNHLTNMNRYVSFLGIIIKNITQITDVSRSEPIARKNTEESVTKLNAIEEKTANLLSPGGSISAKQVLSKIGNTIKNTNILPQQKNDSLIKEKIIFKKRSWPTLFKKAMLNIKELAVNALLLPVLFIKFLLNKIKKEKTTEEIIQNNGALRRINATGWFKNLNKKHKAILIIILICALLLAQNIISAKIETKKEAQRKEYNDMVMEAEQKENQVEANLLYGNKEGAKKIIAELSVLLERLPQENEEQKNKYNSLLEKYNKYTEEVRNAIKENAPEKIVEFNILQDGTRANSFIIKDDEIYLTDSEKKSIYVFNKKENKLNSVLNLPDNIKKNSAPTRINNQIFYLTENNNFIRLSTETDIVEKIENGFNDDQNLISIKSYNGKLYLVNKKNNQIYSYKYSSDSLSAPEPWIKDNVDLSQAVDMSIDGNIYILTNDGKVIKFLKGELEDINMEIVEPPLLGADKIFASNEKEFIYILDSKEKRILIFDKNGSFILQHQFQESFNIKDFSVDEENKKIYILGNDALYGINTQHIN